MSMNQTIAARMTQAGTRLPWRWIIGGVLGLELIMIATAFGWVAIYSYLMNAGHPAEFYEAYAKVASPIVSLVAGIPVFFVACRWIGRRVGSQAVAVSLAITLIYLTIDVILILALAEDQRYNWLMSLANHPTKLLAAYCGGKRASQNVSQ